MGLQVGEWKSTETTSPTLNLIIDLIVRGVVLEEIIESQSLPVEVLDIPANQ